LIFVLSTPHPSKEITVHLETKYISLRQWKSVMQKKMIQSITPIQNEHICLLHLYNIDSPITLNVMTPLTTNILQHYVPPNTKCSIKLLITEDRGRASQANSKKFQPRGIRRTIKCNPISITFNIKINNQETEITPLQLAQALN